MFNETLCCQQGGLTALHVAAGNGHVAIVKELLASDRFDKSNTATEVRLN
jgi:ankyrin repeat protein